MGGEGVVVKGASTEGRSNKVVNNQLWTVKCCHIIFERVSMRYEMQATACKRVAAGVDLYVDGCWVQKIDAFRLWGRGAQSCESSQAATALGGRSGGRAGNTL